MSESKGRPFGGVEKLYLALDEIAVKTFALVAELDKKIPDEIVAPALAQLAKRHPQLNYRIAEDSQFQFWFVCVPENIIPFRVIQAEENHEWADTVAEEINKPFDLVKGPLIRIVLLQKQQESAIIILSNHTLGDGISAIILLQDFLKILSGDKLDHLPVPKSMDESLKEVIEAEDEFIPVQFGSLGKTIKIDTNQVLINKLSLSERLSASLQDRARKEGTTVNSALNAAVATAMSNLDDRFANRPLITRSPISVRKVLGAENDYALNVVTQNIDLRPDYHSDFWEFARKIGAELKNAGSIDQARGYVRTFRDRLLQPVELPKIVKGLEARIDTDFMLSNLGRISENTYGIYSIRALWGPLVISGNGNEQTIGAVTIGGKLFMTSISLSPMPALLTNAAHILVRAL